MAEEKRCKVEGCKRPYRAKGYCISHYKKWRTGELPKESGKTKDIRFRRCSEKECKNREFGRGLCEEHYYAKFKGKKPDAKTEAAPAQA